MFSWNWTRGRRKIDIGSSRLTKKHKLKQTRWLPFSVRKQGYYSCPWLKKGFILPFSLLLFSLFSILLYTSLQLHQVKMERYQGLIFFYQSEIAFHLVQKSPDHLSKALSQLPGKLTVQNQEKVYRVSYEWHSYRKSKEVLVKEDSPKNLPLKNKEDSNSSQ